ncbi:MAG: polymerase, sigma 32 subunit, RpoH, partial [Solirubrobacterales bacterium]|nr:polymerase, sigma 32 subunit, RpoH [Solirubrobacterales bacterium]
MPRTLASRHVKRCHGPQRAGSERALVLAALRGGERAREDLIEALRPAIASVARRYRHTHGVTHAELMQEGVVGLLNGLERYDPQRGVPFWVYASWWVRQAMQQLISEVSRPTVLSDRAQRGLARIREARR